MPNIELAEKANRVAGRANKRLFFFQKPDHYYHVWPEYLPRSEIFNRVTGTVLYVGCSQELSSLFVFPNASTYIHQDLNDPNYPEILRALNRKRIIKKFKVISDGSTKGVSEFEYNGSKKRFIEVHGRTGKADEDFPRTLDNEGNIGFNMPEEAKSNLEAIYFFSMPYQESIRAIQLNVLPYLKIGGFFEGPYPYPNNGKFEGAPPDKLGLEAHEGTFIKTRQLSEAEIQSAIGYSNEDYRNYVAHRHQIYYGS